MDNRTSGGTGNTPDNTQTDNNTNTNTNTNTDVPQTGDNGIMFALAAFKALIVCIMTANKHMGKTKNKFLSVKILYFYYPLGFLNRLYYIGMFVDYIFIPKNLF